MVEGEEENMTIHKTQCDKCLGPIVDGKCDCGIWYMSPDEAPDHVRKRLETLVEFYENGKEMESADHFTGVCSIYFTGDYEKCMKVKMFIRSLG